MTYRLKTVIALLERFKIHHVLFWAVYHLAWWTVYMGSVLDVLRSFAEPHAIIKYLGYVIFQAVGVYFSLYVLIPKYLETGKYLRFFVTVIFSIFLMSVCITANYFVASWVAQTPVYELFNISPPSVITIFKQNAMPSCISAMTLGMSIKLAKNWVDSQKRQQALEKEKLETELKFLKSQFNPHFLFNTINSIFVLINKNPEMASESLVKFSSLLRYQLYECNSNQIPLKNELTYIKSFMELESLRQNENFELEANMPKLLEEEPTIAPFILVPFIENAFKHLSEDRQYKKWIHLDIVLEDSILHFKLSNTANFEIKPDLLEGISYSGLGLRNVRRRLDIVYSNTHSLVIKKEEDVHSVVLEIALSINTVIPLKKISV